MIEWKEFSPKALDFLENSHSRLNILHGSVRSSKTINCTVRWLDYLATGPQGDLCMMGRTTATLQRNVLNDLRDIAGEQNFKWVNKQQGELNLFGRRVYCFGANNEDAESKIRGATFAGAYCDEVTLYPQSVFNQLMARMSVRGAQCFCNTNPDNPYHWFYTDYIMNEHIQDKQVWKFLMEDNLSLDRDYMESLKQMYSGVWYERMILGNWVAAEGRIYDMLDEDKHFIDTAAYLQEKLNGGLHPKAIRYVVACDYGTSSVMTWSFIAVLPSKVYLKLAEYYYDASKVNNVGVQNAQKTDSEFADIFDNWCRENRRRFQVPTSAVFVVYVDPSAASWKVELLRRGYRVQNANNDVLNGIRFVSSCLSSGKYFIDFSCKNTRMEYSTYVWDSKATLNGIDKPLKTHDHTCDADRYALYTDSLYGMSGVY